MQPGEVAIAALLAVAVMMLAEARVSASNERWLRQRGAVEPNADVYRTMQWAYPAAFAVMAAEGAIAGPLPGATSVAGVALFAIGKALKLWAIASLGRRWTFRVLVLPGAPLVTAGPYAFLRHPNYVGVIGELAGMALTVGARISGPFCVAGFAFLIWRRMRVEDEALRDLRPTRGPAGGIY